MQYELLNDIEIVQAVRNGDNDAMDFLLTKYRGMVRKETRKMYLIGADEEDLTQEGMIGLFKAIRDYAPEKQTDFALFAHVCIVRQLYSAVTASNRKKHLPLNTYVSFSTPTQNNGQQGTFGDNLGGSSNNPETQLIAQERVQELMKMIENSLSPMEKKVLNLYLDGYSYEIIGQKLGKEKKAIDNAIQRIRNKLSKKRD